MNSARKRIVFDTSSLIPACLHPDREPARLFRFALLNHTLYSSPEAMKELLVVLSRPKFDAWRPLNQRLAWAGLYQAAVLMVDKCEHVTDCRDAKDNKFLEVALAAPVDLIVSSDRHLIEMHPYRGIAILSLEQFKTQYATPHKR